MHLILVAIELQQHVVAPAQGKALSLPFCHPQNILGSALVAAIGKLGYLPGSLGKLTIVILKPLLQHTLIPLPTARHPYIETAHHLATVIFHHT